MLLLTVMFSLLVTYQCRSITASDKPGVCPHSPPARSCFIIYEPTCHGDNECPGVEKCCFIGPFTCGQKECIADILEDKIVPGSCPASVAYGEPGYRPAICDVFGCSSDAHCNGNEKCCTNACGSTECIPMVWSVLRSKQKQPFKENENQNYLFMITSHYNFLYVLYALDWVLLLLYSFVFLLMEMAQASLICLIV